MLHVSDLYSQDSLAVGTLVQIGGMLLGASFDNLVIADTIEDFDLGVAVPLLDDALLEQLVMSGVYGIGGGRFAYRYNAVIEARLAPGARGYKCALTNIVSLIVSYRGKDVLILPAAPS
jgi:hypothetical protein